MTEVKCPRAKHDTTAIDDQRVPKSEPHKIIWDEMSPTLQKMFAATPILLLPQWCITCREYKESIDRLLLTCPVTLELWWSLETISCNEY